ncbi:MAG: endolytic transglycosylase MltG [Rhodospirillaceae bacterium]|nr:MAG: endolytic transglycosylase MltG [Rhodospirillaceae bacterium]
MFNFIFKFGVTMGAILAAAVVAVLGVGAYWMQPPSSATDNVTFLVSSGDDLRTVAADLEDASLINSADQIILLARMQGVAGSIKAGEFVIPARARPNEILYILVSGKAVNRQVTLPEGITLSVALDRLLAAPGLTGNLTSLPDEGGVLPDTYAFQLNDDRQAVLDRMVAAMDEALSQAWANRSDRSVVQTPDDALILASIIEKETARADERGLVASVYSNRLAQGMRLQADPTLVYFLSRGTGRLGRGLRRSELDDASNPYNTYRHNGLPPGPISNPGRASIEAALNPAETDFLFFVAGCDGRSAFAETYAEHLVNVEAWRACEHLRFGPVVPKPRPADGIPAPQ